MSVSDLRGASREALDTLTQRVQGVGGEDAARLGEDLFGVATLLRSEPGLRRVVTDPSTDASAKSDLARGILSGKVGETALEVVTDGVERRWTRPRDLADALEHLGVFAVVHSAGEDSDRLSDELFSVARMLGEQGDLRTALSDPARSTQDKSRLLGTLLENRTLPATLRLAQQALTGSHRSVVAGIEEYQKLAADAHGQRVAQVVVAHELTEQETSRLRDALSTQYGRKVHLNVVVDPDVLGGVRVEIGDDVIDGTVSSRLDEARRRLAG